MLKLFSSTVSLLSLVTAPAFAGPIDPEAFLSGEFTLGTMIFPNASNDAREYFTFDGGGRLPLGQTFGLRIAGKSLVN